MTVKINGNHTDEMGSIHATKQIQKVEWNDESEEEEEGEDIFDENPFSGWPDMDDWCSIWNCIDVSATGSCSSLSY